MYLCFSNQIPMKYLYFILFTLSTFFIYAQTWEVPKQAELMTNPYTNDAEIVQLGQKVYNNLCKSCHGIDGTGDPVAIKAMKPRPADFTNPDFQKQTDGTIYWKLSEGRGMMAAYKNMLGEKERWAVVKYIRTFKNNKNTSSTEKIVADNNLNNIESFPFTSLINNKTTHIIRPKGFGLVIQHRFGATKFNKEFITNFMGLDLAANMRFAFEIPVNDKLYFEIGRTRYGKYYDFGGKYKIVNQNDKFPFSIAFYENVAITSDKAPDYPTGTTFSNGNEFKYEFAHRLKYDTQLMFSKKFNHWFSGQIATELIWQNLHPVGEKAYVFAAPISMRFKIGMTSAIDFEITPNTRKHTMPMALAYEVASSGNHVFQITITNSDRILSQNILTSPSLKHKDGFMLGFNLIRYF